VRICFSAKSLHSKRLSPPDDHAMHVHGAWTGGANLHGKFGLLGFFFFSSDIIFTDMSQLLPFELWVRWYVHSR